MQNKPLKPPSFAPPPGLISDRSRFKLCSVRVPSSFDVSALDGLKLDLEDHKQSQQQGTVMAKFDFDGRPHGLVRGHPVESETFRLLVRAADGTSSDGDGDNDGDNDGESGRLRTMRPLPLRFDWHMNLSDLSGRDRIDVELAPGAERAPVPSKKEALRVAYAHVPQRTGLRRRWIPAGGRAVPTTASNAKRSLPKKKEEDADGSGAVCVEERMRTVKNEERTPADKRKRAEKKAERSAQKKAKKEKKSEKKAKKEKRRSNISA